MNKEIDDFPIYRIMSIYEFYDLYIKYKLKLSLYSIQLDQNDGIESLLSCIETGIMNVGKKFLTENIRFNQYMTCWTKNKDSIAMWSLYSQNREFIQVKTSYQKLLTIINQFAKDYCFDNQWDKPNESLVSFGNGSILSANYQNLTSLISDIKQVNNLFEEKFLIPSIKGNLSDDIFERRKEMFSKLKEKYKIEEKTFLKDISYSYENEIRGVVSVGLSVGYSSYNDWVNSKESNGIPIRFNSKERNMLPSVQLINAGNNFIDEIYFDPRIEEYKKIAILEMLKIDKRLVKNSNCFTPAIPDNFNFNLWKAFE